MSEDIIRERLVNNLRKGKLQRNLKVDLRKEIVERIKPSTHCEIDVCFKMTGGNKIVGMEVKDEVGYNEILKGIGQAVGYLQYCHGSYIVAPAVYEDDMILAMKNKTNVGLIVYSGNLFRLVIKATLKTPKDDNLISRFTANTLHMWQTFERDNYLEKIFEHCEKYSGRAEKYGKYGFHLLMSSLLNLMLRRKKGSYIEGLQDITGGYYYIKRYKEFYEELDKWFPPQEIIRESERICKKQRKYGKHSRAIINWRLPEAVLVGIVEAEMENKKLLYRINPMFIPKISELLEGWR